MHTYLDCRIIDCDRH